jgi:hypothetical protein
MGPFKNGAIQEWLGLSHLEWVFYFLEKPKNRCIECKSHTLPERCDMMRLPRLLLLSFAPSGADGIVTLA